MLIGLGAMAIGGQSLHEAKVAGERKDIAYAQLVAGMPALGWYRVQGASYSLIDAVTLRGVTGSTLPDVYVRVHPAGVPAGGEAPAKLLVHIEDQQLADHMAATLARLAEEPYPVAGDEKLEEEHPVEGMIESFLTIDRTDQKGVRGALGARLADDYLVIAQGRKPDGTGRGLAILLAGLALVALSGLSLLRRRALPPDEAATE
ncbi:hypothetical protein COO09_05140 [Rhizorhabdus dicambivorans]|uniref:Uncharacterized protein n=1 Tax=Rhizorhabdus dicambivorans TaxID=1850238 RepID=A0A2A4FZP6_9SPHN|nr:hypothetical protein [Rhizorhabdus dicambivorans]ATE63467.1 hypothetical protein CMV14_02820 [Rhizorhabdus dicambivorans]PCE43686.1 hypothetical protein COO09_05140 [Rhizorhabdus dicambivorans]